MADFRKWLLVLAVMALVAVPAGAQSCNLAPGNPTNIRDGGLTELVGDLVLTCNNPTSANITVNLQVFFQGATVSNRVRSGIVINNTPECPYANLSACVTDSMLLINDVTLFTGLQTNPLLPGYQQAPIMGLLQPAVAGTDSPTNRNSVLFPGVVIPAGTIPTTLRVTDVRIVSPALSTIALGLPTQVIESVSFLPQITVQPSFEVVANVLPAMQFAVTKCSDTTKSGDQNYRQCTSVNPDLFGDDSKTGQALQFNVKFTEGFPLAFKPRGTTGQTIPGTSSQINLTESGLTLQPSAATPGFDGVVWAGYADAGTKLKVNFKNIPAGVKVYVTQTQVAIGTTTGFLATGVDSSLNVSGTALCAATGAAYPLMKLNSDNAAIWEVLSPGIPGVARQVSFGVAVAFKANTTAQLPALTGGSTPMTMTGQLWPSSTVAQASSSGSDAIPRFRDVQLPGGNVAIGPCASTLIYPFTSNKVGFETGIAIINTSLDNYNSTKAPLQTATQTGNCLVYFFDGTTSAPLPVDTGTIVPGGQYVNTISGLAKGAAFQGYVIAKCNFQFGHGYAYITDTSASKLGAQGYLALIIPDNGTTSRAPNPFTSYGTNSGEQFAY